MTDERFGTDLFGEPVQSKKKKAASKKAPFVAVPEVKPNRVRRVVRAIVNYIPRFAGGTAHQAAVLVAGTLLGTTILGWWAQVKFDWLGWSQAQIGESTRGKAWRVATTEVNV